MALSRSEISKDVAQQTIEAAIATTGRVVAIAVEASRRITAEVGSFATEVFEILEASRRAGIDEADHTPPTHPPSH